MGPYLKFDIEKTPVILMLTFLSKFIFLNTFFETGSLYEVQAGLGLSILLPQPLQCWDYRCEPPFLTFLNLFFDKMSFSFVPETRYIQLSPWLLYTAVKARQYTICTSVWWP
jgi:hypothetical protein